MLLLLSLIVVLTMKDLIDSVLVVCMVRVLHFDKVEFGAVLALEQLQFELCTVLCNELCRLLNHDLNLRRWNNYSDGLVDKVGIDGRR